MTRPAAQRCCIYRALLSRCVADEDTWKLCVVRNDRPAVLHEVAVLRVRELDLRDTFPFKAVGVFKDVIAGGAELVLPSALQSGGIYYGLHRSWYTVTRTYSSDLDPSFRLSI